MKGESEPLALSHRSFLQKSLQELNIFLSEYSFANLYLFRKIHSYRLIRHHDLSFIKGSTHDGTPFLMPTFQLTEETIPLLKEISLPSPLLFPIPEQWLADLENSLVQASFKEEDSDYLFKITKLADYPGRHLSKKRNLVKQFVENHQIRVTTLGVADLEDFQLVLEQWQNEQSLSSEENDYGPCLEAIQYFQELGLEGRLVYVNDQPSGFVIGEWLTSQCYVVHFSKALHSIKGIYQYLYQDLAQTLQEKGEWINLEQDLGLSNIRQTKHSYLPDQLLRKWRVQLDRG